MIAFNESRESDDRSENHTDAYLLEGPSPRLRKARNQDEEENQDMKSTNLRKIRNEIDSEFETFLP